MNTILIEWRAMVEFAAIIGIVVIAIGLMVGVVDLGRAIQRIGIALGCMILMLMLPPMIVEIWHALKFWQQLGIITLSGLAGMVALQGIKRRPKKRNKTR